MARLLIIILLSLLGGGVASAHGIGLEVTQVREIIEIVAYYDDNDPVVDAKVTLELLDKTIINEARTDKQGKCSLPSPATGLYYVRVDVGDGHVARRRIQITDSHDAAIISDGLTRSEWTGSRRWLLTGSGLVAIAGLTWLIRRFFRSGNRIEATQSDA